MKNSSSESIFEDINNRELELRKLNTKNKFITKKAVNDMLLKYNIKYKIKKLDNFILGTIHTSYLELNNKIINSKTKEFKLLKDKEVEPITEEEAKKCLPLQSNSYERIEFLGDSVIRSILSDYLYNRYSNETEGFLTTLRTKIERTDTLALFCRAIGLNDYIIISKYYEENESREKNRKIQEDVFESFIGALYLDDEKKGFELCKNFLINLVETEVDISSLLHNEDNFKDILLRYFHTKNWGDPKYSLKMEIRNDIKSEYTMQVCDNNGKLLGIGTASSKKKGEQIAAQHALEKLKYFDEESKNKGVKEIKDDSEIDEEELEYLDEDD